MAAASNAKTSAKPEKPAKNAELTKNMSGAAAKNASAAAPAPETAAARRRLPFQPQLGEIAIEASQIISRLEQVAEGGAPDGAFNQPTVFLGLDQKRPEDIVQVTGNCLVDFVVVALAASSVKTRSRRCLFDSIFR